MERELRDTFFWKLELIKKRLFSLRDSSSRSLHEPASMETCLLQMENILTNLDNKILMNGVGNGVQKLEDLIDEVEYEMVGFKYEFLDRDNHELIDDPNCNTSHKRICKEVNNFFSSMVTMCSPNALGQKEFGFEKEQGPVIANHSHEEESTVSSCLQKRKRPCEGHLVGFTSISDFTKRKTNEIVESDNDLENVFSAFELQSSDGKGQERETMMHEISPVFRQRIVGREEDVNIVMKMLLSENVVSNAAISVLPVVGMGGLGKTTLAMMVYHNASVREHFDLIGWLSISETCDLVRVMSELIGTFTSRRCDAADLNDLFSILGCVVTGKNFFVVLDDVWEMSGRDWGFILSSLQSARSGRILLTTRIGEVAKVVQTMPPYSMRGLTPEDSWSLFEQSFHGYEGVPHEMIEIGREIVNKCGGLPLAVKTIGGVLRFNMDIKSWTNLNSEFRESARTGNVLPTLNLSYRYLPETLKVCFVVFSLFPKGFVFSKDDVIRTWMSLNLIENENIELPEDTGSSYFDGLVNRSLIEQNQYCKRLKDFIMHDLVHDLAEKLVVQHDFSRIEVESGYHKSVNGNVRYLSVVVNNLPNTINHQLFQKCSRLNILKIINSVNKWNNNISIDISDEQLRTLKYLRALDFSHTGIEVLLYSIGSLRLLRYLNLSKTNVKKLPKSICILYNLQTLDLRDCFLQELPRGIKNLINLRHLNFWNKNTCMPNGIGALINLQTLPIFNIRRGSWHCQISELRDLVNLRGELTITGLRNITSVKGVKEAKLRNKEHLQVLTLQWTNGNHVKCKHSNFEATRSSDEQCSEGEVLEWLHPNTRLEELHIHDYSGSRFPDWMGDATFYTLSNITISGCGENCEFLPSLGLLPSLKSLSIQWMYSIQRVGREFCSSNATTKGFQSQNDYKNVCLFWQKIQIILKKIKKISMAVRGD